MRPKANETARCIAWVEDASGAAQAADLGFDMIFAPAAMGGPLPVIVDVYLGEVPADEAAGPFVVLPSPLTDPRQPAGRTRMAVVSVSGEQDIDELAAVWALRINGMRAAGVRLLGLDRIPSPLLQRFLVRLRRGIGARTVVAWTPGLGLAALAGLPAGTVDFVVSSLPWWDGRATWFWEELACLRRIAPVLMPSATSAPAEPRWPALAALLGDAWLTPLTVPTERLAALNTLRATLPQGPVSVVSAPGQTLVLLRTDTPDVRQAKRAAILLVNDSDHPVTIDPAAVLMPIGRAFTRFLSTDGLALDPASPHTLRAHTIEVFQAEAPTEAKPVPLQPARATEAAAAARLALEMPAPTVEMGRFPVRRTLGSRVEVEVDVIADGHDKLACVLCWQAPGDPTWHEVRMTPRGNARWGAAFPLVALGVHHYDVQAWRDEFATFADELTRKHAAGVPVTLELQEGAALVARTVERAPEALRTVFATLLRTVSASPEAARLALLSDDTARLMQRADVRAFPVRLDAPIPVRAERAGAGFAAWYEVFPRSLGRDGHTHGTFRDVITHLPRIQAMGFDVLYFPPIHPIGLKNRKGRNNTLTPSPDDPGSPYAIGGAEGGHDALHPELGSFADFQALRAAAEAHGLELAIDFAIQCSPDHPWLQEHKDWFMYRPDGTIRYAENPPKKYEDIVNVDFYAKGAVPGLWLELCRVVLFWAEQGVRLFRVDNPHTKPLPFWEWMIGEVQARYPDAVFLAEAFTHPKLMYRLAKLGFSQSYTYFTWRDQKWEFEQYLNELTQGPAREFFRPHFFVNTPDINPPYLHGAGRSAYLVRAALAATLSGLWGVYNGFELCEGTPVPGREEYLDSEKYQLRQWDWDRPGNIVADITELNRIRRQNPALHTHLGLTFLQSENERVLFFEKANPDRGNVILVAISLDVSRAQGASLDIPFWRYTPEPTALAVTDALTGQRWTWRDRHINVTLPPERPYAVWHIAPEA